VVEQRYGRHRFRVSLRDPLAEGWYDHDWDEPPELGFLISKGLTSGALIFDLGAHQGVVALMLGKLAGDQGRVVAVEALPHNARLARENVALNGVSNVEILNAAAADHEGDLFASTELNASLKPKPSPGTVRVPGVTVDGLAAIYGSPGLVFVDVEGAEVRVLEGAHDTLEAAEAFWMIEVHTGAGLEDMGGSRRSLLERLQGSAYECWVAPVESVQSVEDFKPARSVEELPLQRFFLAGLPPRRGQT
jgi:FkbM family methyltransferase